MAPSRTSDTSSSRDGCDVSQTLLQAVLRGEKAAIARFVLRVTPRVRGTACRICGPIDGEDAAQSALLVILRGLKELREPGSLSFWIDRIVLQTSLAYLRRERRRSSLLRRWWSPGQLPWGQEGESMLCETLAMTRVLGPLSPAERRLFLLRYVVDLSVSEIAELTATPESTIRNRLLRSRKLLARSLNRRNASRVTRAERRRDAA